MKALTATSDGTLYAGGGFEDLENITAADNVAYLNGSGWHAMGTGAGPCTCAVDAFVRGLTANGTDVFVGTDETNVDGIAQADHVVKWDGLGMERAGLEHGGADGWFPTGPDLRPVTVGSNVFAAGTFQNANGEARADDVAWFDGTQWRPVGSDGAGNGPMIGNGFALARVDRQLYPAGNFTSAGGDTQARHAASSGWRRSSPTRRRR